MKHLHTLDLTTQVKHINIMRHDNGFDILINSDILVLVFQVSIHSHKLRNQVRPKLIAVEQHDDGT